MTNLACFLRAFTYLCLLFSFCLMFEWEKVTYTTGNGTGCPEVDGGAIALKVRVGMSVSPSLPAKRIKADPT